MMGSTVLWLLLMNFGPVQLSTRSGLWDTITEREMGLRKLWTYIIKPGFVPKPNVTGGRFSVYCNQLLLY